MIEGVIIEPLKVFEDERGEVRHMLKCDSPYFTRFGEIYFSFINPGYVKAWKKHQKQTQYFCVPVGNIKVVLFDDRKNSSSKGEVQEIEIGEDNYCLLRIPPQIWYGFQSQGNDRALIVNCTDIPHDPQEAMQIDSADHSVPYSWT